MGEFYIQLFSPHGLIRYQNPETGRDRDTGGQVKYVLELLENLSKHPQVRKVDLFTRRIADKRVSSSYDKEIEIVNDKARIVRMSCGGNAYIQKESLWDHLDEFVDKTIRFIEKQDDFPDVVHGHYADGSYIAGQISQVFGIPFVATGHSLGRNKKNILLSNGMSEEKINDKFNMQRRIQTEENTLKNAGAVIVSTSHEIENHYSLYDNKSKAHFEVIPPGVNTDLFFPFYRYDLPAYKMSFEQEHAVYRVNSDIERFLFNPAKPLVLSIGRADKRKNFENIIQSYGQDKELQAMANLAIFAGVRKDISQMPDDEKDILTNLLLLLDKFDLYGKMAIPKKNDPTLDVPEIYRLAARRKGVFVNATPGENFGLTIVEAAACGLPVVASPTGGPKEILEKGNNGILVDVEDPAAISGALKKIVSDQALWEKYSENGISAVNQLYSWEAHCDRYIEVVKHLFEVDVKEVMPKLPFGKKLVKAKQFIISDLDGTLVEGNETEGLKELKQWIVAQKDEVVFGIASGRNRELTEEAFKKYDLPYPDIIICSAGSEIYYTDKFIPDHGWESHIDFKWKRKELLEALKYFPGIQLQEEAAQRRFKLSYYVSSSFNDDNLADLYKFLDDKKLRAKILLTENKFLDLLPFRSGKGNAIRYLSYKWKVPLDQFITAGNSGNDKDMLTGKIKGIVVANYSPEMEELKESKFIYFTKHRLSKGVMEGIHFYNAAS
ncbi:MAG: HAD family hydrolase [Agriterribacter sp.]